MRAMVRWARGRGDLDDNLMEGMRKPSETVERDRVLSSREIEILWRALPGAGHAGMHPAHHPALPDHRATRR